MSRILVAPSILSADFACMGREVALLEDSGADLVHCDVMDGVFVPNITFGIKMIEDIRPHTRLPLDVHLMIVEPEKYVERFVEAGADIITFHVEATKEIESTLKRISALNCKCGIVVKPDTDIEVAFKYLELCDMVLVMGVYPGFGGQRFIEATLDRLRTLKSHIDQIGKAIDIEIDGGVNQSNVTDIKRAGANVLVAGNAYFSAADRAAVVADLKSD